MVLLFPNEPWEAGQLERLGVSSTTAGRCSSWASTRFGRDADGKLIDVAAGQERNRFNEVLAHTAIRVNFDSAMFAVGGWLHSYEALAHPTAAGIARRTERVRGGDRRSLDVRLPARPLLVGRYGWGDPGDEPAARG